jgi:hypothetical protein
VILALIPGRPIVVEPNEIVSNRDGEEHEIYVSTVAILDSVDLAASRLGHIRHHNGDDTGTKTAAKPSTGAEHIGIASFDVYTHRTANFTTRPIHLLQPFPEVCSAIHVARSTAEWSY